MEIGNVIPSATKESHESEKEMLLLQLFPDLTQYFFNAKKVMDLILQLAVQGKLTASWRASHPELISGTNSAKSLLEKIKVEKEKLAENGKIRKINKYPNVESKEMNFKIPDKWTWCRFDEIVINRDGERKPITKSDRVHGDYDYYGASGVIDKVKDYIFDKDLLLIGEDGANLIARSSPIAFFARGKYWVNNHAHVLDATDFSILEYLERFINAINLEDYITGMAQPKMPQKRMNLIAVPLPPLEEQKEIVRIVDQLKEEVDTLNRLTEERKKKKQQFVTSSLHHLTDTGDVQHWNLLKDHFHDTLDELENVKKLRETILQLAVQGKLTAKWRLGHPELIEGDHSAKSLLEKIKAEKEKLIAEKVIKKEKPLPEIMEDEKPYELPVSWEWVRMGNVITLKSGQDLKPDEYSDTEEIGLPYVTGASNIKNEKVTISRWTNAPRSIAYMGDLLLTCKGSGVGKMGWLEEKEAHIARQIMAINTVLVDLNFVKLIVQGKFLFFKEQANGLIPGIDRGTVLNITIGIPSLEEQKEIVRQVDHLMSLCDQLESHITTRNTSAEQLMKAVVGEVLGGEQSSQGR